MSLHFDPWLKKDHASARAHWVAMIRALGEGHRTRVLRHLMALNDADRYLRFGFIASDEQINRYVAHLNFTSDAVFGIYDRELVLVAMAHLALCKDQHMHACAEFGVSVLPQARGHGYGQQLFERAVLHARNVGVEMFFIHALSENKDMLMIAKHAGARVEREGPESTAYLRLPQATVESHVSEIIDENLAKTDYQLKRQARKFLTFLATLQEIRADIQDARHQSGA